MNTKSFASLITAVVSFSAAQGAILFTSLDPAATSTSGAGATNTQFAAVLFIPSISGALTDITFDAFANPSPGGAWTLSLYTNTSHPPFPSTGNQPSTVLESWTATVPSVSSFSSSNPNATDTTLTSVVHPVLTAGTMYWFVIDDTHFNSSTAQPNIGWAGMPGEPTGGFWTGNTFNNLNEVNSGLPLGALKVDGSPVPEPASLVLMGLGVAMLAIRRSRAAR